MPEDILTELRSIDPLLERKIDDGLLVRHRREFLGEIVATEPTERIKDGRPAGVRRRDRRFLPLGIAVSIVALVALVLVLSGRGGSAEDRSAYASQLVEFAESTPLILLDSPGFSVTYVTGDAAAGMMVFEKEQAGRPAISAELNWFERPSFGARVKDWAHDSNRLRPDPPVLGTKAIAFENSYSRGLHDITAIWRLDGRTLEIRSAVPEVADFRDMLASLKQVDSTTWLDAMPPSVIRSADPTDELGKMLEGIPLPPGFDESDIRIPGLAQDRYQFGAIVAGTVTCSWFAYWVEARKNGNEAAEREAVEAMSTARDWSVLKEMSKTGGFPTAIWSFAESMPSGKWVGRPLEGDVSSGLGCPSLGVTFTNERKQ